MYTSVFRKKQLQAFTHKKLLYIQYKIHSYSYILKHLPTLCTPPRIEKKKKENLRQRNNEIFELYTYGYEMVNDFCYF